MELKPVSNNRLTLLRKLSRKKYRQQEHLFIVEGLRAVEQVFKNGLITIDGLYFDTGQQLWERTEWQEKPERIESHLVEESDFLEITDTDNPQGVLALCRIPEESTARKLSNERGIMIATDEIQDPGNLGTMIRTACWFGVTGILAGKGTVDLFHPKVVRSTAGATGAIPYLNADLLTDLMYFEQEGWKVVLLDSGPGSQDISSLEKREKVVLVVGNEANGINENMFTSGRISGTICPPIAEPAVESLNASIALSIALYSVSGLQMRGPNL